MDGTGQALQSSDLVVNLLASAIWLIAGLALSRVVTYARRGRHLRRIWRLPRARAAVRVVVATIEPVAPMTYRRPSTGAGELKAVGHLQESLSASYSARQHPVVVDMSAEYEPSGEAETLVCVGGPRHNATTRRTLKDLDCRFAFDLGEPTTVVDNETGERYLPQVKEVEDRRDYAVILRCPNPFDRKAPAFVLAGAHTFGVAASAKMFTKGYIAELSRAVKGLGPYWEVLLEVDCVNDQTIPTVRDAAALKFRGRSR